MENNFFDLIHSLKKNTARIVSIVSMVKDKNALEWDFPKDSTNADFLQAVEDLKKDWIKFYSIINEREETWN